MNSIVNYETLSYAPLLHTSVNLELALKIDFSHIIMFFQCGLSLTAGFLVWITVEAVSLMYGFAGLQISILSLVLFHCSHFV